jgi:hypothetical protein
MILLTFRVLTPPTYISPRAIRQQQFEYAYIFGAACPAKDKALGLKVG